MGIQQLKLLLEGDFQKGYDTEGAEKEEGWVKVTVFFLGKTWVRFVQTKGDLDDAIRGSVSQAVASVLNDWMKKVHGGRIPDEETIGRVVSKTLREKNYRVERWAGEPPENARKIYHRSFYGKLGYARRKSREEEARDKGE